MWISITSAITGVVTGLWFLTPAVRTLVRPRFQPTSRNDVSIFYAQQASHP